MSDSEERPRSELGSGAKPVDAGARGLSSGITPAQRSRAWLITGAGIALSLVACALAQHRENAQNRDAFDRRASVLTGAIARSFQMTREVVLSLPALFEASVRVEQREPGPQLCRCLPGVPGGEEDLGADERRSRRRGVEPLDQLHGLREPTLAQPEGRQGAPCLHQWLGPDVLGHRECTSSGSASSHWPAASRTEP